MTMAIRVYANAKNGVLRVINQQRGNFQIEISIGFFI